MGLLDGLLGHAGEIKIEEVQKEFEGLLIEGEGVQLAFKLIRDLLVFTDKRLILVDRQGLSGKKVEYVSIPYRSITHFSVETAGHFDLESELKLWISGQSEPILREFKKGSNLRAVQMALARYVLG